jgi:glycine/D-amino acid oxidase-like deaminating enzyme
MFPLARSTLAALGPPQSLWAATAAPGPSLSALQGEARADVAVVGGGICGLVTALHLSEGGAQVALLEAEAIGAGASGRNGGQVIPGLKLDPEELLRLYGHTVGEPLVDFVGRTADEVFDLIARHRIECDAVRGGWIQAAHDQPSLRAVQARARQWSERGAPVESLDALQVAALTGARGYCGGWIDRRGGRVQPLDYCRGLARAALAAGARLYQHSEVRALEPSTRGWRLSTGGGTLLAERVILCMNAYARLQGVGARLSRAYIPIASMQLASEPLPPEIRAGVLKGGVVVSDTHPLLHYFRQDAAGRLLMGGPGTLRALRRPSQMRPLLEWVEKLFPGLREYYRPHYYWGGDVARTLDHLPHLHELHSGVLTFYGCNGRGVALATAAARQLARWGLGARTADLPLPSTRLRTIPLHAGYPLYIQIARAYFTLREQLKRAGAPARPESGPLALERPTTPP